MAPPQTRACRDLDPAFATGLDRAADAGVEVLVYACDVTLAEVRIGARLPWRQGGEAPLAETP